MREYAIGTKHDLRSALTADNIRVLAIRDVERKVERGDCLFQQHRGQELRAPDAIAGNLTHPARRPATKVVSWLTDLIGLMRY